MDLLTWHTETVPNLLKQKGARIVNVEIEIEQTLYIDGEEIEAHRVRIPATTSGLLLNKQFDSAREALEKFRLTVDTHLDDREPPF